jgi:transposase-like protein
MKYFNYDLFLEDIKRIESIAKCPKCKSDYIFSTAFDYYDFLCGSCGHHFVPKHGKYKKEMYTLFNNIYKKMDNNHD